MNAPAAAIAGIYEYPDRVIPGKSVLQIKAECAARALADAGLAWQDVDALYDTMEAGTSADPAHLSGLHISEYLGLRPRVIDTTAVGGSSYELQAAHAVRDIRAGRARVALLTYGSLARSSTRRPDDRAGGPPPTPSASLELPYGLSLAGSYALVARRHMHEYGTTPEQLAEIAVTCRYHALRNPDAVRGLSASTSRQGGRKEVTELTAADVLASRPIADPLHLLDCCLITDGGGAVVIVAADVAAGTRTRPAWILGTGEAPGYVANGSDITVTAGARSAPAAFAEAGLRADEIDVAMVYDSFTITTLAALEDLGFCKKGEGGPFAAGGRLRYDRPGAVALNTDGGGLSSNHPGMRGLFLLIEATRQLRGESTAQVPGARLAVAHGTGGSLGARHVAGTVILGVN
jgi:acetyl-CoA C-acetyltransferase